MHILLLCTFFVNHWDYIWSHNITHSNCSIRSLVLCWLWIIVNFLRIGQDPIVFSISARQSFSRWLRFQFANFCSYSLDSIGLSWKSRSFVFELSPSSHKLRLFINSQKRHRQPHSIQQTTEFIYTNCILSEYYLKTLDIVVLISFEAFSSLFVSNLSTTTYFTLLIIAPRLL